VFLHPYAVASVNYRKTNVIIVNECYVHVPAPDPQSAATLAEHGSASTWSVGDFLGNQRQKSYKKIVNPCHSLLKSNVPAPDSEGATTVAEHGSASTWSIRDFLGKTIVKNDE